MISFINTLFFRKLGLLVKVALVSKQYSMIFLSHDSQQICHEESAAKPVRIASKKGISRSRRAFRRLTSV